MHAGGRGVVGTRQWVTMNDLRIILTIVPSGLTFMFTEIHPKLAVSDIAIIKAPLHLRVASKWISVFKNVCLFY